MATTKFYLDTRTARKDGTCPLKVNLSHRRKTALISLGVSLLPRQWDCTRCRIKGVPNMAALNAFITQRKLEIDSALLEIVQEGGDIASMGAVKFRDRVMERVGIGKARTEDCGGIDKDCGGSSPGRSGGSLRFITVR